MTVGKQSELDQVLVQRFQAGDMEAFNLLAERYQWRLKRLALRYVKNEEEAADLVQESLLKAYRSLPEFRGQSAFYSWLYRITLNTVKNYLQSRQSNEPLNFEDFLSEKIIEHSSPETLLACDQLEKSLFFALGHLSDELRSALVLRELMGFSYEEIAEILQCPLGTVRSRLSRGRQNMMDELKPFLSRD